MSVYKKYWEIECSVCHYINYIDDTYFYGGTRVKCMCCKKLLEKSGKEIQLISENGSEMSGCAVINCYRKMNSTAK